MKKILLFTGISAISIASFADVSGPKEIEDAIFHSISPNGKYAVTESPMGMRIFDVETGKELSEWGYEPYDAGQSKCVSNNGIIVAISTEDGAPSYWKDGEWYRLPIPSSSRFSNLAQAISADGSRICGSLGVGSLSYDDDDVLMQSPCVWNAEGDGYSSPVMLPHPKYDFTGRVPQYITAIDISADGKTVIGQIRECTGRFNYPIIYKEDEKGEWSYEIPFEHLLNPDNLTIEPYPGDGPMMPQCESYMTQEEIDAYNEAFQEYIDSGYQIPCPEYQDFMTPNEIFEYNKAADEYNKLAEAYNEKYYKYFLTINALSAAAPDYDFNAVRISPDGNTYGCTVCKAIENSPNPNAPEIARSVWLFDLSTEKVTKYEKDNDLNLVYIADEGIGVATTLAGSPSQSFILKNDVATDMYSWMNARVPEYAKWMEDNMVFPYEKTYYNEEGEQESVEVDILMTGRAVTTPDFSVMILSVQNVWDFLDDGIAYIFDMQAGDGVDTIQPDSKDERIYDLYGRKLKNAEAPGIYIINGEKKAVP